METAVPIHALEDVDMVFEQEHGIVDTERERYTG